MAPPLRILLLALAMLVCAPPATAQTTFQVHVVSNTSHPDPQAWPEVYAIDGVQGADLTLTRGQTYVFQMNGVPAMHPFYLTTNATGGGAAPFTTGVTGTPASGSVQVTFIVPVNAPDLLFYQCTTHPRMGGRLNIISGVGNDPAEAPLVFALSAPYPNPFNPQTRVTLSVDRAQPVTVAAFDALGRRVAVLHDGMLEAREHLFTLDGSRLASGLYVIRASGIGTQISRRVALLK
jgi:hypothetical protein